MGTDYGIYSWVGAQVMVNLMGRRFGWVVDVFLDFSRGRGTLRGRGNSNEGKYSVLSRFHRIGLLVDKDDLINYQLLII
jgi:hypothetical protein